MAKISKKFARQIIGTFLERGWHFSPSGLTGQLVLDWCHAASVAYRLDVVPGVGATIVWLDHPSQGGTLTADLRNALTLLTGSRPGWFTYTHGKPPFVYEDGTPIRNERSKVALLAPPLRPYTVVLLKPANICDVENDTYTALVDAVDLRDAIKVARKEAYDAAMQDHLEGTETIAAPEGPHDFEVLVVFDGKHNPVFFGWQMPL
jgi:hypothetical protein